MPIIQCDIREGRSKQQLEELAREITSVVHETIDAPNEYIYVLIRETPGFNHIKGGNTSPTISPERVDDQQIRKIRESMGSGWVNCSEWGSGSNYEKSCLAYLIFRS